MSKRILFSVLFTFTIWISNSQTKLLEYGFNGGMNFNSSYGSSFANKGASISIGYNVGGYIKSRILNHVGIKVGLQYEQDGWAYRSLILEDYSGSNIKTFDLIYKLNYLNLPILVEYSSGSKVKFKANGGFFIGTLLNNVIVEKVRERSTPNHSDITRSSSDFYRRNNFGISAGIGIGIPLASRLNLLLDVRDNLGLTGVTKAPANSTQKTNSVSISSGLAFPL